MLEGFGSINFGQVGGWTLFVIQGLITIQAYRKGLIVPKIRVDELRADHETTLIQMRKDYMDRIAQMREDFSQRVHEAIVRENEWRDTAEVVLQTNTELARQNGRLIDELRLVGNTMDAVHNIATGGRSSG